MRKSHLTANQIGELNSLGAVFSPSDILNGVSVDVLLDLMPHEITQYTLTVECAKDEYIAAYIDLDCWPFLSGDKCSVFRHKHLIDAVFELFKWYLTEGVKIEAQYGKKED